MHSAAPCLAKVTKLFITPFMHHHHHASVHVCPHVCPMRDHARTSTASQQNNSLADQHQTNTPGLTRCIGAVLCCSAVLHLHAHSDTTHAPMESRYSCLLPISLQLQCRGHTVEFRQQYLVNAARGWHFRIFGARNHG
jgi:hypothetical protein